MFIHFDRCDLPLSKGHRTVEEDLMLSAIYWLAAVIAALLAVYLIVCLLTPEVL